jgi:hypothetical protein
MTRLAAVTSETAASHGLTTFPICDLCCVSSTEFILSAKRDVLLVFNERVLCDMCVTLLHSRDVRIPGVNSWDSLGTRSVNFQKWTSGKNTSGFFQNLGSVANVFDLCFSVVGSTRH